MNPEPLIHRDGALIDARGQRADWPSLAILGDPVAHSLSPRMHGAALEASGIEGCYRAIQVKSVELEACVRSAWDAGMHGLQLTLPHKERVLPYCSTNSPEVQRLGAANTLRRGAEGWEAHNTDLPGLVRALRESFPQAPWKGSCAVVGAGGAARACLSALDELDAGSRLVLARDPKRAAWVRQWGAKLGELGVTPLEDLTLLLQATPLGLNAEDPSPVDPASLPEGCAVMDLCYCNPAPRLVREHAARGPVADGRAMLIAQAEIAFELWFPGRQVRGLMRSALGL